jgi:hypothetical protein
LNADALTAIDVEERGVGPVTASAWPPSEMTGTCAVPKFLPVIVSAPVVVLKLTCVICG